MKNLLLLFLFLLSSPAFAQDYRSLVAKASALYDNKDYSQSVVLYQQAFKIEQKKPRDLYNAACSAALTANKKLAFRWLSRAIKNGWMNVAHLQTDPDLAALHGAKKWDKLVADLQKKVDDLEAHYDKPLQAELLQIGEADQKYRRQIGEIQQKYGLASEEMQILRKTMWEQDSINTLKITALLDKQGWVGPDQVGEPASQVLFLVIQHANFPVQQKYLPMMQQAVRDKKAAASALALLEDRVALGEKRKQVYGSQIGIDKKTGAYYVSPLADPDHVDERRNAVGLGPLADYVKRWNIDWNVEAYKKQLPEIEAKEGMKN